MAKPTDEYGKGLVVLLSPGLANILALCTHAAGIPKLSKMTMKISRISAKLLKVVGCRAT